MDKVLGWKPTFIKYTINLNEEAKAGNLDPVAKREKEISQLITILSRRTKNNPLVIGAPGVGKTAIVEGLVQKIVAKDVPPDLSTKVVFQLDFSALIAGARKKGEVEQRLKELTGELTSSSDIILFVDDIHLLLENAQNSYAASTFKQYLDHNQLSIIGTTTRQQYEKYFDQNKSFERAFQPVDIDEPGEEDTFSMLQAHKQKLENFHRVSISDDILRYAAAASIKYIPTRSLPDKALDLIDEASARVKISNENGKRKSRQVRKDDIDSIISEWTGVQITKLTQDESEKLLKLEKLVHRKFVGQQHAVTAVAEAVRRGRIGLTSSTRPIASFLFSGPSGVGKTELVKVLSQTLFDREDALLQLDMSEFMEKQDVSKLIGAPPGFTGYEAGGILTEFVSQKPSAIVMMDNIEKAHSDISNLLLQVLEEGKLTDNKGNHVSFKNTIIVCTTAKGSELVSEKIISLGPDAKQQDVDSVLNSMQPAIKEELLKLFAPEIINRFDSIVSFKPLTQQDMIEIGQLLLSETAGLLKNQGFVLQITESALKQLALEGYDPKEGARPVRRLIKEHIENPVALAIISKKFVSGNPILVDFVIEKGFYISNGAVSVLEQVAINLPEIADVAMADVPEQAKQKEDAEIDKIYKLLKKLANPDSVTDQNEKQKIAELKQMLSNEQAKGNPTAEVILNAAAALQENKKAVLPKKNKIQTVSDKEYEQAERILEENYLRLQGSDKSIEEQTDWIKKDLERTETIIKLLSSDNPDDKDHALAQIVSILPFLLIGGFSEEQILAYLTIKTRAANTALATIQEEEETKLAVPKQEKPQQQTMQASL